MPRSTLLYAGRRVPGDRDLETFPWEHFYLSPIGVTMCGHSDDEVDLVLVEEHPEGPYWAWWDAQEQRICMVYPDEGLVEVCFPYGTKVATKHGDGEVIRVRAILQESNP